MFASNTVGTAIVLVGGVFTVPLPNNQILDGFTPLVGNTVFQVPVTGRYYITYQVNTTAAINVGTRLELDPVGLPGPVDIPGSIVDPLLAASVYNNDVIVNLTAGDTISLQIFSAVPLIGAAALLGGLLSPGSTGAALTIIRLS